MATRYSFRAFDAAFPSANFPQRAEVNSAERYQVLAFDGANAETCFFDFVAPQGIVAPYSLVLYLWFPTATSGNVIFEASVQAVQPGDSLNFSATTSYDSANVSGAIAAPASIFNLVSETIPLTSNDGLAAGETARIKLTRNPANASDTILTDTHLYLAEFRDSA
jgi:hypothetical protein